MDSEFIPRYGIGYAQMIAFAVKAMITILEYLLEFVRLEKASARIRLEVIGDTGGKSTSS